MSEGEEGSSTWKYVGIGCAILALLGLCSAGSCVLFCGGAIGAGVAAMEPPVEATRTFFASVRSGDTAGAYAQTAESYRASHTVEQLEASLAAMPALAASSDQTILNRSVQAGQGATMGGTLDDGTSFQAHLVDEAGVWRIDSLTVGGSSL
jgi:hypothetical protein